MTPVIVTGVFFMPANDKKSACSYYECFHLRNKFRAEKLHNICRFAAKGGYSAFTRTFLWGCQPDEPAGSAAAEAALSSPRGRTIFCI